MAFINHQKSKVTTAVNLHRLYNRRKERHSKTNQPYDRSYKGNGSSTMTA